MARCAYNNWPNGSGTVGGATGYLNTFALGHEAMTMALSVSLFLGGAACGGVLACQVPVCAGKLYCEELVVEPF
ncbi:expansin-A14-like [Physcomitrium patens]|uniref:expansin-A14-like n=1 Tax=Physcomitrium patens TaxID=3218 RepID=UPI003CCCDD10